jgi:hypothetical protein
MSANGTENSSSKYSRTCKKNAYKAGRVFPKLIQYSFDIYNKVELHEE